MSKVYYKNKEYTVKGSTKKVDIGNGWMTIGDKQICWGSVPSTNTYDGGDLHERHAYAAFAKPFGNTPTVVISRTDDPSGRGEFGAIGGKDANGFTLFFGGITVGTSNLTNAATYIAFGNKA